MGCGASTKRDVVPVTSSEEAPTDTKKDVAMEKANNEDIRDKYDLGKVLGSGSFGQVREAILKENSDIRAVKMIERDNDDGEWSNQAIFVREVGLLQQIKHENIIRYFDFYEDLHFLYVVMELCKGGEVFAKIVELKRFSERNAALIGQQMLRAIEYIHKLCIAHRDIKAENFMLADSSLNAVKMIDFGMACKFKEDEVLTELCGSPHYLAPELIGQKYNHLADVWAFGVLMYLLMYGHYPYDAKHPRDIMVKILTEPVQWQTKAKIGKDAINFLKSLLEHNPKKRFTAELGLNHPWMRIANSLNDGELLNPETVRSAHKKVTATRKIIDPKVDEARNVKLNRIDEDYSKGVRHGKRLGETPKEDYMSKPEFLRRENKITTAPSRDLNSRRESLNKMIKGAFNKGAPGKKTGELEAIKDDGQEDSLGELPERKQWRSHSVTNAPRRLSYIGALSAEEEVKLVKLYEEKQTPLSPSDARAPPEGADQPLTCVVPTPSPPALPTTPGEAETVS